MGVNKVAERDWFAEFKGKQRLTESEVNLMKKRLNDGKFKSSRLRRGGYALTNDQVVKGQRWLLSKCYTQRRDVRKNSPFGYREQEILDTFKTIRLYGFHDVARYGQMSYYVPVYEVIGKEDAFVYEMVNGEVSIVG